MKPGIAIGSGLIDPYKLGCATVVACVFVPLLVLSALRTNQPNPTVNLQVWISSKGSAAADGGVLVVDDGEASNASSSSTPGETSDARSSSTPASTAAVQPGVNSSPSNTSEAFPIRVEDKGEIDVSSHLATLLPENPPLPQNSTILEVTLEAMEEKLAQGESDSTTLISTNDELDKSSTPTGNNQMLSQLDKKSSGSPSTMDDTKEESSPEQQVDPTTQTRMNSHEDIGAEEGEKSRVECDFSQVRTDICELHGDVRIHGPSSMVKLVVAPQHATQNIVNEDSPNTSWKIRPYARKWEGQSTLSLVKELTISVSDPIIGGDDNSHQKCNILHPNLPGIVFSIGGFQGNFFHDLADVMIPLFLTSHKYNGEVQFLIVDFKPQWVKRYRPLLTQLSRYEIINLDADNKVHCFKYVIVGLKSNQELGINPDNAPEGLSMLDFRKFLRRSFQLKREFVLAPPQQPDGSIVYSTNRKPTRMVIVSRKKTRVLINERQVARMARRMGYKVVIAGLQQMKNLTQMARIVNSCDVLLGMHGAGLTNMVFLPTNATMIQIIPWGDMKYPCRFSYGDPAVAMGLRYLEYEIGKKESSLIKQYPKDHPVFTDPLSIHKQGFVAIWSTFLSQDITVDLGRFKGILQQALLPS